MFIRLGFFPSEHASENEPMSSLSLVNYRRLGSFRVTDSHSHSLSVLIYCPGSADLSSSQSTFFYIQQAISSLRLRKVWENLTKCHCSQRAFRISFCTSVNPCWLSQKTFFFYFFFYFIAFPLPSFCDISAIFHQSFFIFSLKLTYLFI